MHFGPRPTRPGSRRQHQLTGEVRLLLDEQVSIPLGGLFDPTQLAAKAQIPGAALEAAELQAIARLANDVAAWQALLQSPPARLAGRLPGFPSSPPALTTSLRPLAESIERKIQPDGSLADNASPELGRIRREQERQQRVIEESLRAALRKLSSDGVNAGRPHHHPRRALRDSRAHANSSAASPAWCTAPARPARPSTWSRSKPSSRTTSWSA